MIYILCGDDTLTLNPPVPLDIATAGSPKKDCLIIYIDINICELLNIIIYHKPMNFGGPEFEEQPAASTEALPFARRREPVPQHKEPNVINGQLANRGGPAPAP